MLTISATKMFCSAHQKYRAETNVKRDKINQ